MVEAEGQPKRLLMILASDWNRPRAWARHPTDSIRGGNYCRKEKECPRPYTIPGGADKDKGVIPTAPWFPDQGAIKVAIRYFCVYFAQNKKRTRK